MANSSTVAGTAIVVSNEASSTHCVITGYIRDLTGNAMGGSVLIFRYIHYPIAVSTTTLHIKERLVARAGSDGKFTIKLLQGAKVKIEIPGRVVDMVRICNIPSTATANIIDILFPRVTSADFAETTLSISVGESKTPVVTGTLSDGETMAVTNAITLGTSNSNIVSVSGSTLKGVSAGTATISISAIDTSVLSLKKEPDGDAIIVSGESDPTITSQITVTVG